MFYELQFKIPFNKHYLSLNKQQPAKNGPNRSKFQLRRLFGNCFNGDFIDRNPEINPKKQFYSNPILKARLYSHITQKLLPWVRET